MKCGGCEEYIGGTARTLGTRLKEYIDGKYHNSAVTEHTSSTGHKYTLADVNVLVREDSDFKRKVKEAIAIHKRQQALKRDIGHEIPPILLKLVSCDQSGHVMEYSFDH